MKDEKFTQLPIFQKAAEIEQLVRAFIETIPPDDDFLQTIGRLMHENALLLQTKIAGAEGGNLYDIRMQNAAIIRQAGLDLFVQIGSLRFYENFGHLDYIELIRGEILTFRSLFVKWVESFDGSHYLWDDWGLFNPPHATEKNPLDDLGEMDWDEEEEDDPDSPEG